MLASSSRQHARACLVRCGPELRAGRLALSCRSTVGDGAGETGWTRSAATGSCRRRSGRQARRARQPRTRSARDLADRPGAGQPHARARGRSVNSSSSRATPSQPPWPSGPPAASAHSTGRPMNTPRTERQRGQHVLGAADAAIDVDLGAAAGQRGGDLRQRVRRRPRTGRAGGRRDWTPARPTPRRTPRCARHRPAALP